MKLKRLLFFIPLFTLFSCNHNNEITTKCPLGAPSLVYYDQGNNKNFDTISGAVQIIAEFQQDKYDALVVDATSGLNQIIAYPETNFRFAKLLTAGNLYLVSAKHNLESELPNNESKIFYFGADDSVPSLVVKYLANNKWHTDKLEYRDNVQLVLSFAINDLDKKEYDYFVLAEPVMRKYLAAAKEKEISVSSLILTDSKLFGNAIPQAALFINQKTYISKREKFTTYLNDLNIRIDNCINNIDLIKSKLDEFGDDSVVEGKFGFNSKVAYTVQQNNGFAIYPNNLKYDYIQMNNFMTLVSGTAPYSEDQFINVE